MPRWLPPFAVQAIHDDQIGQHGGLPGVKDPGGLDSALARPKHLKAYGSNPGLHELAACYAFSLATTQCFNDGNKRVALMSAYVFLDMNGFKLTASEEDAVAVICGVAQSKISEQELAKWIDQNMERL